MSRAELFELLHGNMVEGGDEYAVLHLVCGDGVDDALLQTLVEYLVVLQLHIEQHIGLVAEIEQLIKRSRYAVLRIRGTSRSRCPAGASPRRCGP